MWQHADKSRRPYGAAMKLRKVIDESYRFHKKGKSVLFKQGINRHPGDDGEENHRDG